MYSIRIGQLTVLSKSPQAQTEAMQIARKHAREIVSSALWLPGTIAQCFPTECVKQRRLCRRFPVLVEYTRNFLQQRFRALPRPSSDFERPVAAEHARAVISSATCETAAPVQCFQVLSKKKGMLER